MRLLLLCGWPLAVVSCSPVGGDGPQRSEPDRSEPIVLREEQAGEAVEVRRGELIEVHLVGDRPSTGWEINLTNETVLEPAEKPFPEVSPAPGQTDPYVGTYVFRFRAVHVGKTELTFNYLYPAGPGERRRTERVRSVTFKITVAE